MDEKERKQIMKIKIYYDEWGTVRLTKVMNGNVENIITIIDKGESVELDIQSQVSYKMERKVSK